jgi:hypothetical protein
MIEKNNRERRMVSYSDIHSQVVYDIELEPAGRFIVYGSFFASLFHHPIWELIFSAIKLPLPIFTSWHRPISGMITCSRQGRAYRSNSQSIAQPPTPFKTPVLTLEGL